MLEIQSCERALRLLAAGLTVTVSLIRSLSPRESPLVEDLEAALAAAVLLEELGAMARALADQELAVALAAANAALAEGGVKPVNCAFGRLVRVLMDRLDLGLWQAPAVLLDS